jgi:hypothetical protein
VSAISNVFTSVSKYSSYSCFVEKDDIREAALIAREIAMQFGVNPANLQLLRPEQGEEVEIGTEFHDCYDGDTHAGRRYIVDLVTLPGLQKIGDGRSDRTSVRTIVPCDVFVDRGK